MLASLAWLWPGNSANGHDYNNSDNNIDINEKKRKEREARLCASLLAGSRELNERACIPPRSVSHMAGPAFGTQDAGALETRAINLDTSSQDDDGGDEW